MKNKHYIFFIRILFSCLCISFFPFLTLNVFAAIELITLDRVNLREQASTDSNILHVLEPRTDIVIMEIMDDGWMKATYSGFSGYIREEYVGSEEQYTDLMQYAAVTQQASYTPLITLDRVNLREHATTDSAVLQVLDPRTDITVTEILDIGWASVTYREFSGYIKAEYVGTEEQYTTLLKQMAEQYAASGRRKAELLEWNVVKEIFTLNTSVEIYDVYSGKIYYVKSFSNGLHADVEPITANDTAIMKETYGGVWQWDARPVLATINGRTIAAAINGMPHAGGINATNGMDGQVCLHFKNSSVHNGNMSYNKELQNAVIIAYNRHQ